LIKEILKDTILKIFITGGYGFIGSHFTDLMLYNQHEVMIYDSLTYATQLNYNIEYSIDIFEKEVVFSKNSIIDKESLHKALIFFKPDVIVNFAAESHVDRSLENDDILSPRIGYQCIFGRWKESVGNIFGEVINIERTGKLFRRGCEREPLILTSPIPFRIKSR